MTSGTPRSSFHWIQALLTKWRKPPKATALPLGLEVQQVEGLRRLLQSPHWTPYSALVDRVTLEQIEVLLHPLPHEKYLFQCGVVFACRRLSELPTTILAKVTELETHANVRNRASAAAADATGAAFLNTPWWDAYIRDSARANGNGPGPDLSDHSRMGE